MTMINRQSYFKAAKRLVVKVGSNVLTADQGLNLPVIYSLSTQISHLMASGIEVILVSSGAMASGQKKIGLSKRPDETPKRQAIAAVGQPGLMLEYEKAFGVYGIKVAQILLTGDDLTASRDRYLNARNTLNTLLSWKIIPVINENDTVVVEEIQFGDNDNLSAMIALLMNADFLINLTDIDGLYTGDPRRQKNVELISEVETIDGSIETIAGDIPGALGSGGMLSKVRAAAKVTNAGIPMIIANGREADSLKKLFSGENLGTFFIPAKEKLSSRKCWIGYNIKPKGTLRIDEGAVMAILQRGKSLLPGGIIDVEGDFGVGDAVELSGENNSRIAVGLVNYSASDIRKIMGCKTDQIQECLGQKLYDEVIHRDNLTILNECLL
ncbi:MAG: glutamate 5-kinase [Desulfobacteraceae bacterium]|nr:glutamate 5-kinase [Desulfobacteraceae bacterium]MBC2756624.1 glutamate 5-kinase [Desulfobacteraceae bacterium]